MKKPIAITLFILFFFAATAHADLAITPSVLDLGEIRGGAPLQASFQLTNSGTEPIEILEVNRGCDCLTPRLDKRLLEPGGKATLSMAIRTLGHANGPHSWTAAIRYRDGNNIREAPLGIRALVKNDVMVQPAVCALFFDKTLRQEITVTDLRRPPLTVTRVETTAQAIKAHIKPLDVGVTKILLEANGVGLAPGRYDEMLSIYTSDPLYGQLQVPLTLTRADPNAVLATPAEVKLGVDPGQPFPTTLIRLRPRGEQALVITKVTADDPAVRCTWAAGPGSDATLRVQVSSAHSLDTYIHVHFQEPLRKVLVIPVHFNVR